MAEQGKFSPTNLKHDDELNGRMSNSKTKEGDVAQRRWSIQVQALATLIMAP